MTQGFSWYELRTLDLEAAREFYAALRLDLRMELGRTVLCLGGRPVGELSLLPERARGQGAPPHWLGHLHVNDVEGLATRVVGIGGERLGPARLCDGFEVVGLRDPFGVPLALTSRTATVQLPWHELHTPERARSALLCASHFELHNTDSLELGAELGTFQLFTWAGVATNAGGILSTAGRPGVHPHWLFYFGVRDLESALNEVAFRAGRVLHGPRPMPNRMRGAVCEDPQGAVFGLVAS